MYIHDVTVLLFASYADAFGSDRIEVDVPAGATVRELLERVRAFPAASKLPPSPLVAVNERYARADQTLHPGDEVALIPPVAGG